MRNVPLKEIMTSPAVSVRDNAPFSLVEEKLRLKGIRHLPVVDQYNTLIGLMSERDLYRTLSPRKSIDGQTVYDSEQLNGFILKNIMTPHPTALHPEDPVSKAVELMAFHKYGCIPIVDLGGHLVGIITEIDVLKLLHRELSNFKAA